MSERASTDSPRACSGERYCAVPITALVAVTDVAASLMALAIPKSITFASPWVFIIMFAGLISR